MKNAEHMDHGFLLIDREYESGFELINAIHIKLSRVISGKCIVSI